MASVIEINNRKARQLHDSVSRGRVHRVRDDRGVESTPANVADLTKIIDFRQVASVAQTANPNAVIQKTIELIRHKLDGRISLYAFFPKSIWPVAIGSELLQQAVTNLCLYLHEAMVAALENSNRRTRTEAGGVPYLSVELENAEVSEAFFRSDGRAAVYCQYVVLTVSGNCPGLFDEDYKTLPGAEQSMARLQNASSLVRRQHGWFDEYIDPGRHAAYRAFLPRCVDASPLCREDKELTAGSPAGVEIGEGEV